MYIYVPLFRPNYKLRTTPYCRECDAPQGAISSTRGVRTTYPMGMLNTKCVVRDPACSFFYSACHKHYPSKLSTLFYKLSTLLCKLSTLFYKLSTNIIRTIPIHVGASCPAQSRPRRLSHNTLYHFINHSDYP